MSAYTVDCLKANGPKFAMGYLLPRVAAHTGITYGEVASRLEKDLKVNGNIFPIHVGEVAGALQDRIHEVDPDAPLLNALIARADNDKASSGVDPYLEVRFGESALGSRPQMKEQLLKRAIEEVYAFTDWDEIYRKAFGGPTPSSDPLTIVDGQERDGQTPGGEPESAEHKRLKAFVSANPGLVGAEGRLDGARQEYCLLSADKVDIFFQKRDEFWLVEVKSERSDDRDLTRGCYQCVKYWAVFKAQTSRTQPDARIHAVLVTTRPLPADDKAFAREHDIRCVVVDPSQLKA